MLTGYYPGPVGDYWPSTGSLALPTAHWVPVALGVPSHWAPVASTGQSPFLPVFLNFLFLFLFLEATTKNFLSQEGSRPASRRILPPLFNGLVVLVILTVLLTMLCGIAAAIGSYAPHKF